jgi:hypothetical protein
MSFSELYSSVLAPFVTKYKDSNNDKERKTVVSEAADAVKDAKELLENAQDLPKDIRTVSISFNFLSFLVEI